MKNNLHFCRCRIGDFLLSLLLEKRVAIKSGDKKVAIKSSDKRNGEKTLAQKAAVIQYLTENVEGTSNELAELLGVSISRVKVIIAELVADEIVITEGANRNRKYKLKK